jgi:hypothetical protein
VLKAEEKRYPQEDNEKNIKMNTIPYQPSSLKFITHIVYVCIPLQYKVYDTVHVVKCFVALNF